VSQSIIHVTDSSFEQDVLKVHDPGAARLLGRVVRPLQDDRAHPRRDRGPTTPGRGDRREDERRRESAHAHEVQRPRHPDADPLQGRPRRGPEDRRRAQAGRRRLPGRQGCEGLSRQPGPQPSGQARAAAAASPTATAGRGRTSCRRDDFVEGEDLGRHQPDGARGQPPLDEPERAQAQADTAAC